MVNYNELPENARVWVYQSNKPFSEEQLTVLDNKLEAFVEKWLSHGSAVRAWGGIKYNRFIILVVDESYEAPSGCSIDSSVAFIKNIENEFNVDLFDRFNFAYKVDEQTILSANRDDFAALFATQQINGQTIVFNNLVQTKGDLEKKWEVQLENSWHVNMV